MLFSEIYGSYFHAVSELLKLAIEGELDEKAMYRVVRNIGFEESPTVVPKALKSGEWPLITEDFTTPVKVHPRTPLTILQKRWMKSLLTDPKIRLFDVDETGLEDVAPLFDKNTIIYFDRYNDGDPFEDEQYIKNFRTVLKAIREKRKIRIRFRSVGTGKEYKWDCIPYRLEYSLKDDKFRFFIYESGHINTINISTILECALLEKYDACKMQDFEPEKRRLVLELTDERNALERVLLHFSHLQKETIKKDDGKYMIKLTYHEQDETEILIRILSFGPMIKVMEPQSFVNLIKERLKMQRQL